MIFMAAGLLHFDSCEAEVGFCAPITKLATMINLCVPRLEIVHHGTPALYISFMISYTSDVIPTN